MSNTFKKIWDFLWHSDSLASWVVSFIVAFIVVKFVIYAGIGLLLGTSYPIVAVVSGSMEHNGVGFDQWWEENKDWYENKNIAKEDFETYIFKNGFNKGDIMILVGDESKDINKGDVIVFQASNTAHPVIHRVVKVSENDNDYYFQTKGDNNEDSYEQLGETKISEDKLIGKAVIRIPWLGWVKIIFAEIIQ
ncbi:signal peptidase I [Candidatus Woesearchaeota archaeon]|nr:signal peptidase I [Candidatus Woesearchaeota archaeon]